MCPDLHFQPPLAHACKNQGQKSIHSNDRVQNRLAVQYRLRWCNFQYTQGPQKQNKHPGYVSVEYCTHYIIFWATKIICGDKIFLELVAYPDGTGRLRPTLNPWHKIFENLTEVFRTCFLCTQLHYYTVIYCLFHISNYVMYLCRCGFSLSTMTPDSAPKWKSWVVGTLLQWIDLWQTAVSG